MSACGDSCRKMADCSGKSKKETNLQDIAYNERQTSNMLAPAGNVQEKPW